MREEEKYYIVHVLDILSKKPDYPCFRLNQDYLGFMLFAKEKKETHYLITLYDEPDLMLRGIDAYMNIVAWYLELKLNDKREESKSI